jgi:hypothetical protein
MEALLRTISFEHNLSLGTMVRVHITKERGLILSFVVQLECLVEGDWCPIVRYDTAHGFAHRDILRPDGTQEKQPIPVTDFNEALTYAQRDIKAHWRSYLEQYRRRLK